MGSIIERTMYAARWLLAPIYIGLSLTLVALGIKFFQEVFHLIPHVLEMTEADVVLIVLSLIDIALVSGLIIMVMFTSYENFVSRLELKEETEKLSSLGHLDTTPLKSKVATTIVAISSIHLLNTLVNTTHVDDYKLLWFVLLHMTVVGSGGALRLLDTATHNT